LDLTDTIAADSDQLDAVDLLSGARTFTIEKVGANNAEQPVNIKLVEFPRVWRPGKSMRRVLVACWGPDASKYVGRRVTLYCDPDVRFGGQAVGGTRISHLSHIDKPAKVALLIARGKSAIFVVQPLVETSPAPEQVDWVTELAEAAGDVVALKALYKRAGQLEPNNRALGERIAKAGKDAAAAAAEVVDDSALEAADEVSQQQMKRLHAQLGNLDVKGEDRHHIFSVLLQREITSAKDITAPEMRGLIDLLDSLLKQDDPKAVLASTLEQVGGAEAGRG
jgi:hypothetical protein